MSRSNDHSLEGGPEGGTSFFLELFGELEPGERVELRPINRHDQSKPSSRFFKSVQEFIKTAAKQTPPFDQYFGVNIRNGNGGNRTHALISIFTIGYKDYSWPQMEDTPFDTPYRRHSNRSARPIKQI